MILQPMKYCKGLANTPLPIPPGVRAAGYGPTEQRWSGEREKGVDTGQVTCYHDYGVLTQEGQGGSGWLGEN